MLSYSKSWSKYFWSRSVVCLILLLILMLKLQIAGAAGTINNEIDSDFNPSIGRGSSVSKVVIQADNKLIIAGSFVRIANQPQSYLARLNADGSLDMTFRPALNDPVRAIALQPDGKLIVAGTFTKLNGQTSGSILRLNSDGSLDAGFKLYPNTKGGVSALALQSDGKIVVAGALTFTDSVYSAQVRLTRLNPDGSLDPSLSVDFNTNSFINALAVQPDNKLLVGGSFDQIAAQAQANLARLNADGSLDASFKPSVGMVQNIAVQADHSFLISGSFAQVNGQTRSCLAWFNADSTLKPSFSPNLGLATATDRCSYGNALEVQTDGKVLLAGGFYDSAGEYYRNTVRFNLDGSLDKSFDIGRESDRAIGISVMARQKDGKIVLGGNFAEKAGERRLGLARLLADGHLDPAFAPFVTENDEVTSLLVQSDGKILVAGYFRFVGEQPYQNIVRLNPDGSIDKSFRASTDGTITIMQEQSDGKILVAGGFGYLNNVFHHCLGRLNSDGSLDTSFNPGIAYGQCVFALALQADGKVIIGGYFREVGAETHIGLARLHADGSVDSSFKPSINAYNEDSVVAIKVLANQKILVAGSFTQVSEQARSGVARLNPDGSLDSSFNAGSAVKPGVHAIALQKDGKIVVCDAEMRQYTYLMPPGRILRLNSDGSADSSFVKPLETDIFASALIVQDDGSIVLGGKFSLIDGQSRNKFARLMSDGRLDSSFNPYPREPDSYSNNVGVAALAIQSDGKLLVGGRYAFIADHERLSLARFSDPIYGIYVPVALR